MSIRLALTPDPRWTAGAAEVASAAAGAGFDAVGLGPNQATPQAGAALADAGIRCHELLALIITKDEQRTLAEAERLAGLAAAAGAQWVLVGNRLPLTDESAAVYAKCAALFDEVGSGLALEFSPLGAAKSIDAALAIVDAVAPARAGVLIDTWHFFNGPSTWEQLEAVPLDKIAYVQFADAQPPIGDDGFNETFNRRTWPGEGIFDLHRFADTLRDHGWDGIVSVEMLNEQDATLPLPEYARRAYETTARYWQ